MSNHITTISSGEAMTTENKTLIYHNDPLEYADSFGASATNVYELNDGRIQILEPHWGTDGIDNESRFVYRITVPKSHATIIKDYIKALDDDVDYDNFDWSQIQATILDYLVCNKIPHTSYRLPSTK